MLSLNAISLVNLVISLGIAVEFCSHIARGYMSSASTLAADGPSGQKERDERVFATLVDVGPSVRSPSFCFLLLLLTWIPWLGSVRNYLHQTDRHRDPWPHEI